MLWLLISHIQQLNLQFNDRLLAITQYSTYPSGNKVAPCSNRSFFSFAHCSWFHLFSSYTLAVRHGLIRQHLVWSGHTTSTGNGRGYYVLGQLHSAVWLIDTSEMPELTSPLILTQKRCSAFVVIMFFSHCVFNGLQAVQLHSCPMAAYLLQQLVNTMVLPHKYGLPVITTLSCCGTRFDR